MAEHLGGHKRSRLATKDNEEGTSQQWQNLVDSKEERQSLQHREDTHSSQNTAEQADQQRSKVMYSKSEIFQLLFSSIRWILLKWDFVN